MLFLSLRSGDLQNSFNRLVILFVVAFVLLADLLRLVEVVVDVALCVVQLLRNLRHAQAVILLDHDGLSELGVLGSDDLNRISDGHPLCELLKSGVSLRYAAHGVSVLIPRQVRQLSVTALRIRAVLAAVLLRARDQRLQLAGDHTATLAVFTAVLGAQLIRVCLLAHLHPCLSALFMDTSYHTNLFLETVCYKGRHPNLPVCCKGLPLNWCCPFSRV